MAKQVSETMTYDASCADVFAMMTNEDYVAAKLTGTGGQDLDIDISEQGSDTIVTAKRSLPAQIPSFMKAFVGESIQVTEVTQWSPADDLGARTAKTTLELAGTPAAGSGTLDLRPTETGCEILVTIDVKASVPLVGGKIEGFITDMVGKAVRKENQIGQEWLAK